MAVASAQRERPLTGRGGAAGGEMPLACFGELGLTGELRYVAHPERRVAEASKFGLGAVLGPAGGEAIEGLTPQRDLRAALAAALGGGRSKPGRGDRLRPAA
jgi:DNA repair protein RadA/Sms